MAYPTTFIEKKSAAYVNIANAVASEATDTPNHDKRLSIARQFASGGGGCDWFVTVDFEVQGYNDETALATMENRLSGLLTNLVALL